MEIINIEISDKSALKALKAGDLVSLNGVIYTARDAAHKRLFENIEKGLDLPIDLNGAVIYYTGATPKKENEPYGSCGPTTSKRMDKYTPKMLDMGMSAIIGKGARAHEVTESIKKNKAVYFVAIGGAGAFYKSAIKSAELIAYPELLSEAIYKLDVQNFKCIVGIDSNGNSIF